MMWQRICLMMLLVIGLTACGGGVSSAPPAPATSLTRTVTIAWTANRESGVNSAGGGYTLTVGGVTYDIPYVSGAAAAPTSKDVSLASGSYNATLKAYAALDVSGGSTGSTSAATSLSITVP
jgi:hypothetical protein